MKKKSNKLGIIFLVLGILCLENRISNSAEIKINKYLVIAHLIGALDDYYLQKIDFPSLQTLWKEGLNKLGLESSKIDYLLGRLEAIISQEKEVNTARICLLIEMIKIKPPKDVLSALAENFYDWKVEIKNLLVKADFSLAEEVISQMTFLRIDLLLFGIDSFSLPREILALSIPEEAKIIIEKLQKSERKSVISTLAEAVAFLEENKLSGVFAKLTEKKELLEKFLNYNCFDELAQIFIKLGEESAKIISILLDPPSEFSGDNGWLNARASGLAMVIEKMEEVNLIFTIRILKDLESEKSARILEHIFFVQRGRLLAHKEMDLEKGGEIINKISFLSLTLLTRDFIEAIAEAPLQMHSWENILNYVSAERQEILKTFYQVYTQIDSLTNATAGNLAKMLEALLEKNIIQDGYPIEILIANLMLETTVHFEERKEWEKLQHWAEIFNFMQPQKVAQLLSTFAYKYEKERSYHQIGMLSPTTTLGYLLNMDLNKSKEVFISLRDFDYQFKLQSTLVKYLLFPEKYIPIYLPYVSYFSQYKEALLNSLDLNTLFLIQTVLFFLSKPITKIVSPSEEPAVGALLDFIQEINPDKGEKLRIFTDFLRNPQSEKLIALFPLTDCRTLAKVLEIFPDENAGMLLQALAEKDISLAGKIAGEMDKEELLASVVNQPQMINIFNEIEKENPQHPFLKEALLISGKVFDPFTGNILSQKKIEIRIKINYGEGISEYLFFTFTDEVGNYKAVIPLWGRFLSPLIITLSVGSSQTILKLSSPEINWGKRIILDLGLPPQPPIPQIPLIEDKDHFLPFIPL
ncbi:MAG: hypothetical protein NC834_07090 [Candidatus Omnitrophica bacterium]|nr:hypothetical protein [Candidatus Omnitrophota bacterium]